MEDSKKKVNRVSARESLVSLFILLSAIHQSTTIYYYPAYHRMIHFQAQQFHMASVIF